MRLVPVLLLASAATWAQPLFAADALKFGPAPSWVHQRSIPQAKATQAPVSLLLQDEQIHLERGKTTTFSESAVKIENAQGLGAGNLSIVWQPATDTVTINKLQIRRGDKIIDVLASGQTFTVLRRETNLDAATLDGTLTATLQPEGLQEGDVIDLATTVERSDPVLKGHVEAMFAAWDGLPIQSAHASLSWPSDLHLNFRQTPGIPTPQRSSVNGMSVLDLSAQNVDPLVPPKGAPTRYMIGRLAEASDFTSWSDLANLMIPLFRDASVIPASGPLHDEVEKIRASTADPKSRATQALDLVQDRVRYVALLMGQGGYVPAPAEQTWSRRFGDCKGKTALLLGILHSLGISAEPVLVQAKLGDIIAERLPMIGLFNHVLVRAHIGHKDYWLDGTRTGDTDLDSIETPDFKWGLPLISHAELVRMVPAPLATPRIEHKVTIDASAGIYAPAATTIEEISRGDSAVALNAAYSALTPEQRDQLVHDTAKSYFDTFTVSSSSLQFDKAKRTFDLTIKGTAKLAWKDNWLSVPTSSLAFDPDFDRADGPFHDVPIAVKHPRYIESKAEIRLPPGFAAQQRLATPVHETLAGVEYIRTETVDGDTVTLSSSERSIEPEVPYQEAVAAVPKLRSLNKSDVYLSSSVAYAPTAKDFTALAQATPGSADEYVDRADLFLNAEKFDQAIADYSEALKLDPTNKSALAGRGMARVWKRDFEDGRKDLAAVEASDPNNSLALRAEGLMAESKGDCAKAVDFYTRSLAQEPGNTFSLGHRSQCEAFLSKDAEALADSSEALESDPAWTDLRTMRANIFIKQNNRAAAAHEAELSKSENPQANFAFVAAARIYSGLGMKEQMMAAFDRALAIKPAAYIYLERSQSRPLADDAGRMADIDQALKLEPENTDVLVNKAFYLVQDGKYAQAIDYYDRAIKGDNSVDVGANRAVALYKAGKIDEAQKTFASLRSRAKTAVELNSLCWIKATAGILLESALQDCQDSLKLSPQSGPIEDSLGMVLLKLGRLDGALEAYNQAIAKNTGAESLMGRAFVYLRKGDRARADEDVAAARKIFPSIDDTFAVYGLKFDKLPETAAAATSAQSK